MERSFPRHTRRRTPRVLAVVCALLALTVASALTVAQADDLEEKQDEVKNHIKHEEGELEHSSRALHKATKRLGAARAELATAQRHLRGTRAQLAAARAVDRQMRAKLVLARAELASARAELRQGRIDVANQRDDIARMAANQYVYGDPNLLGLAAVMNANDPSDLTTQLNTADLLANKESTTLDVLQETRDRLARTEARVEVAKNKVSAQKSASRAVVVRKKKLKVSAEKAKVAVARMVNSRKRIEAHAARLRARDARQLANLRKEEKRIRHLIWVRSQQQQQGGFNGNSGGFLHRPVPGYVTSSFGWRNHPIYGYWGLHNGTDFHAPCGTAMRAGANGTVMSTYYSSVWGNRLLLDVGRVNGKNLTLVYNHISGYRVRSGRVGRGDVVAYSGTTGWSTGCHLHFTVLLDGRPVNPMKYM